MINWHDVAAADELVMGEVLAVLVAGIPVAVFLIEDGIFALHDLCSHGHARLSDGFVEDGCVECPLHQGLVDIRSGAAQSAPITEAVRSYPVRRVGDRLEVGLVTSSK